MIFDLNLINNYLMKIIMNYYLKNCFNKITFLLTAPSNKIIKVIHITKNLIIIFQ